MAYQKLSFPIPTPTQLGMIAERSGAGYVTDYLRVGPSHIMTQHPAVPASTTNPSYVETGPDQWVNIYTGEIVDAETMDAVAQVAATNPSILTAPVSSLPANLRSSAIETQLQNGTVQTAASAGIGPGAPPQGIMAWFQGVTRIGGISIPNWLLAGGGGVLAFSFLGKSGRRR